MSSPREDKAQGPVSRARPRDARVKAGPALGGAPPTVSPAPHPHPRAGAVGKAGLYNLCVAWKALSGTDKGRGERRQETKGDGHLSRVPQQVHQLLTSLPLLSLLNGGAEGLPEEVAVAIHISHHHCPWTICFGSRRSGRGQQAARSLSSV